MVFGTKPKPEQNLQSIGHFYLDEDSAGESLVADLGAVDSGPNTNKPAEG